MGNFNGDRGGNRGGFGGGNRGGFQKRGGFERGGDMPTYKAVCAECGKSCDVPFRPTSGKPVYCNDCFGVKREQEDRAPRKEFGNRAFAKPSFERNDRPRDNFAGRSEFAKPAVSVNTEKLEKQMTDISYKLDALTRAIEKLSTVQAPVVKQPTVVAPKVEVKKEVKKVVAKAAPKVAVKKVVAPKKAVSSKVVVAKKKK
ncbi:MAG: CxxC-x17-CxxC domain-containing protein [bacterium]